MNNTIENNGYNGYDDATNTRDTMNTNKIIDGERANKS